MPDDPQELSLVDALDLTVEDLHAYLAQPNARARLEELAATAGEQEREELAEALRWDDEFPWFTDPPAPPKTPPSPPTPPLDADVAEMLERSTEEWLAPNADDRAKIDEVLSPVLPWPADPQGEADRIEELVQRGDPVGVPNARGLVEQCRSDRFPVGLKREVHSLIDAAGVYPDERGDALLNRAARLIAGAEAALEDLEPFGTVLSRKQYIAPDYTVRLRETDGRGRVREQIIAEVSPEDFAPGAPMEPAAPAKTGLGAPDKTGNVTIQPEDASGLTGEQWLGLPEDARENLLRGQSATVKVK